LTVDNSEIINQSASFIFDIIIKKSTGVKHRKPSDLLQVLGIGFGIAILVGNSVGIGILRMPGEVASHLHSEWPIMGLWVLIGVLSLIGATIYAEASAAYPYSGGPYAISEHVFGQGPGFTVGCCDWILNTSGNAALSIAASEYFIITLTGYPLSKAGLAALIIIMLSFIQWFGMHSSRVIQHSLSILKTLGLLFLVGAFFVHGHTAAAPHRTAAWAIHSPVSIFGAMVFSFRAVFFTYAGWNAPIYFAEENKDPVRSIPRSLIWGVASITVIYVLVNAALLYLMPVSAIAQSKLAVAEGAHIVFGHQARLIVTIISIIIVLSGLYPSVLFAPRIIFGMARSGIFFPFAATVNSYFIPGAALIASGAIAIIFALSGTFEFVIAMTTFLFLFVDTSVYAAALYSRWTGRAAFPFHAPGFPVAHIFMILVNAALVASIFVKDPRSSIYGTLIILSTVPLYFVYKRKVHPKM
jgi:APA family basic amino acid/polyamine antiporter